MAVLDKKRDKLIILNKYEGKCAYCGCELTLSTLHVDHIQPKKRHMPYSHRGSDVFINLNPSCMSCNSSKGSRTIDEWRVEIHKKKARLLDDSSIARVLLRFRLIEFKSGFPEFYYEKYERVRLK